MAVFTNITHSELEKWLIPLNLGKLIDFKGIASGIENSNFFVTLEQNKIKTTYVLTIFEVLTTEQLPFYLQLMEHLAIKKLPVPRPYSDQQGQLFRPLSGKPACLVSKLAGNEATEITPAHCASVGRTLAQMHLAAQDFLASQPNLRGLNWCCDMENKVAEFLPSDIADQLHQELNEQKAFAQTKTYKDLKSGAGHCDLFIDNVLFANPEEPAFIDFYFAGIDKWLFDLAVTVNDWCINRTTGELIPEHTHAMLNAYHQINPLNANDLAAWPMMLRAAALRFWISRLFDFYQTRQATMLTPKDPTHFERILNQRHQLTTPIWINE